MTNTQTYVIYYFFTAIAMLGCISTFCVCVHTLKRIYKSEKEAKIKLIPIPRQIDEFYQDKIKSTAEHLNNQRDINKELEDYIELFESEYFAYKAEVEKLKTLHKDWQKQLEYLEKEIDTIKATHHIDIQTIHNIKDKVKRINNGEGVYTA